MTADKPTRVLLLRHAETSAPHLFHGAESDVGLSEQGLRRSEAIAPALSLEHPVAVVSSPMRRAARVVETATPIARACGLPLTIEPSFHERRIGLLAGQTYDAAKGPWAETLRRWQSGDLGYATDHAESFIAVRNRILPAWHRLAQSLVGQTYVVVAHGAVIKILLLSLDLHPYSDAPSFAWDDFRCPNLGVHELLYRPGCWHLARMEHSDFDPLS